MLYWRIHLFCLILKLTVPVINRIETTLLGTPLVCVLSREMDWLCVAARPTPECPFSPEGHIFPLPSLAIRYAILFVPGYIAPLLTLLPARSFLCSHMTLQPAHLLVILMTSKFHEFFPLKLTIFAVQFGQTWTQHTPPGAALST